MDKHKSKISHFYSSALKTTSICTACGASWQCDANVTIWGHKDNNAFYNLWENQDTRIRMTHATPYWIPKAPFCVQSQLDFEKLTLGGINSHFRQMISAHVSTWNIKKENDFKTIDKHNSKISHFYSSAPKTTSICTACGGSWQCDVNVTISCHKGDNAFYNMWENEDTRIRMTDATPYWI